MQYDQSRPAKMSPHQKPSFSPPPRLRGSARTHSLVFHFGLVVASLCLAEHVFAQPADKIEGEVRFEPTAEEAAVAERFRLASHTFPFQAKRLGIDSPTIEVWDVTFPSPVVTPHEANNTVHGEYYRPKGEGKRPAVVVLHILGGDFPLSRLFCNTLAQHGVAAIFIKMPYYGERQPLDSSRRMITPDPQETIEGMTQAVLDIRRATAWLASRDEVDPQQLGIFGISLGGITGALAAANEPRLQNICLLLAGGDVAKVAWDSPELRKVRGKLPVDAGSRQKFLEALAIIDPVTYSANARGRRILMLNASDDEVIPRHCTEALWNALGQPEIQWYSGGHYSVVRHIFSALDRAARFFLATRGASEPTPIFKTETPVVLDGKLDEDCWRKARPIEVNHRFKRQGLVTTPSPMTARVAWDERYLYVAYEVNGRGGAEFLLSPRSPEDLWTVQHNAANQLTFRRCKVPAEAIWTKQGQPKSVDIQCQDLPVVDGDRIKSPSAAVVETKSGYIGEIRIPWGRLGIVAMKQRDIRVPLLAVLRDAPEEGISHTSGELPSQLPHFSVSRWPRYHLK